MVEKGFEQVYRLPYLARSQLEGYDPVDEEKAYPRAGRADEACPPVSFRGGRAPSVGVDEHREDLQDHERPEHASHPHEIRYHVRGRERRGRAYGEPEQEPGRTAENESQAHKFS